MSPSVTRNGWKLAGASAPHLGAAISTENSVFTLSKPLLATSGPNPGKMLKKIH